MHAVGLLRPPELEVTQGRRLGDRDERREIGSLRILRLLDPRRRRQRRRVFLSLTEDLDSIQPLALSLASWARAKLIGSASPALAETSFKKSVKLPWPRSQ